VTVDDLDNIDYRPNQNLSTSVIITANRTAVLTTLAKKALFSNAAIIGIVLGGVALGTDLSLVRRFFAFASP
jgi:hypothetical protein